MKKKNQFNFSTKLMAIILCILMVVTMAVTSIYMLINLIKGDDKDDRSCPQDATLFWQQEQRG